MEIFINGKSIATDRPGSLAELLQQQGIRTEGTAVAINNRVIPRSQWGSTPVEDQMKITVISAVCGG